jgi:hypothetical protein
MIGDIIMLAGYIATCATVDNDDELAETNPTALEATDPTPATAGPTADNPDDSPEPARLLTPATPLSGAASNPASPAKLTGGALNAGNADATVVAPA